MRERRGCITSNWQHAHNLRSDTCLSAAAFMTGVDFKFKTRSDAIITVTLRQASGEIKAYKILKTRRNYYSK